MVKTCTWRMGTDCGGEIKERSMFMEEIKKIESNSNKALLVNACDKHFTEHREVMGLVGHGFEIEKIIRWSVKVRRYIMKYFNILPEK